GRGWARWDRFLRYGPRGSRARGPRRARRPRGGGRCLRGRCGGGGGGGPAGLVDLEVKEAAFEIGAEEIGGAHLLSGFDGAVVHALVPDHLLEELNGLRGQSVVHDGRHHSIV